MLSLSLSHPLVSHHVIDPPGTPFLWNRQNVSDDRRARLPSIGCALCGTDHRLISLSSTLRLSPSPLPSFGTSWNVTSRYRLPDNRDLPKLAARSTSPFVFYFPIPTSMSADSLTTIVHLRRPGYESCHPAEPQTPRDLPSEHTWRSSPRFPWQ
jgi:hypothetical protein